jgi:exodeoxyribonuclease-5
MQLSSDQLEALTYVSKWLDGTTPPIYTQEMRNGRVRNITVGTSHDYPVCSVGGYAGTGKTTILATVASDQPRAVLVTPTHKAAQVLRSKLPPALAARVQTFHSLIYTPDPKFTCDYTGAPMQLIDCGCAPETDCECDPQLDPCQYHGSTPEGVSGELCEPKETLKFVKREHLTGLYSLIVVDEASMLTTSQVQDLRSFGLPILLVGDPGQLPPVVSNG